MFVYLIFYAFALRMSERKSKRESGATYRKQKRRKLEEQEKMRGALNTFLKAAVPSSSALQEGVPEKPETPPERCSHSESEGMIEN